MAGAPNKDPNLEKEEENRCSLCFSILHGPRIIGTMILVNPNVTDLSAGNALINAFNITLETTWLPGFEQSYERRMNEYQIALEKHENRGLFLRTLIRKPKRPNRLPAGYKEETIQRLRTAWYNSIAAVPPAALLETLKPLQEGLDDSYLAIAELLLQANLAAPLIVLGPPGIILAANEGPKQPYQPPAEQALQESAIALREQLQQTEWPDMPIHAGRPTYWEEKLAEIGAQQVLDQQELFTLTDTLLSRHQELSMESTFSALSSAENLTEVEKDNLLRMAATL